MSEHELRLLVHPGMLDPLALDLLVHHQQQVVLLLELALGLDQVFWIQWYMYTPDIRACPLLRAGRQGEWNTVNSNQL